MASSQYAIYDRPKQEWTINVISKQVSKSNPQNTMVFTNSIEKIVNETNVGQIHFIVDAENRKVSPIVSIHKKLLLNNNNMILNSEFLQFIKAKENEYNQKKNWFSYGEFFIMKTKAQWIKKVIVNKEDQQEEMNTDQFDKYFRENFYHSGLDLDNPFDLSFDQMKQNMNNNINGKDKPRLSINLKNTNKNNNNNSNNRNNSKFIGNCINHDFGNMNTNI